MSVKISIIVPCYKQAEFLEDALKSVQEQSFENWECIIVNDGSPDNTKEIAKKWLALDGRFKYLQQVNLGVSTARNFGISRAEGKYILPLDADDIIGAKYIENALDEFDKNSNLKLVYCQARKFGEIEEHWNLTEFSLHQLASNNMIFCSSIFKKSDWQKIDGYDEKMDVGFEDWEFWISILKNGGEVKKLDIIGFYYRIKHSSRTKQLTSEKEKILFEYMSIKHADFFVAEYGSFFSLRNKIALVENSYKEKLKSEKYVIDLFLYKFFKFTIFGKFKP
jgi:glycosyltransferase involved in cell wall biosynthesis